VCLTVLATAVLPAAAARADCPLLDPGCVVTSNPGGVENVPASGGVLDDPQGTVDDTVDTTQGTVNDTVDTTQGTVNDTVDTVQGTVGGAVETAQETIDGVLGTGDPGGGGGGGTGGGRTQATDPTGQTGRPGSGPDGDHTTSGSSNSGGGGPGGPGGGTADTATTNVPADTGTSLPGNGTSSQTTGDANGGPRPPAHDGVIGSLPPIAAIGFPLALAVVVLLFLGVQNWIDRRDPKLRLALVATDSLPFS
jgi:hypothetical protein